MDYRSEKYPERKYNIGPNEFLYKNSNNYLYNFFDSFIIDNVNGNKIKEKCYLSEDYGFCYLWEKIGGEIFADITTSLSHNTSNIIFSGSFAK